MQLSKIKTNVATIEGGLWIDNIPEMGDLRLKVRPAIAPTVSALRAKLVRAVSPTDRDERGDVVFEVSDRIAVQILIGAVLVGWDNLTDAAGAAIPFTPQASSEILSDPDMMIFRFAVEWAANVASYQAFDLEGTVLGNSEAPSAGA